LEKARVEFEIMAFFNKLDYVEFYFGKRAVIKLETFFVRINLGCFINFGFIVETIEIINE
jgi:hypothetical protein